MHHSRAGRGDRGRARRRGLGPATIMKRDDRYIDPLTGEKGIEFEAVETEILGQAFIVNALKTRLDELMPEPLADVARQDEQSADMRKLLAAARSASAIGTGSDARVHERAPTDAGCRPASGTDDTNGRR